MDDKLNAIMLKSAAMFQEYGIRSISMDDICREMGISKKTIYQYFDNKTDLIKKLLDHISYAHEDEKTKLREMNLNAIDVLLEVSKHISRNIKKFNPSVTFDLKKYYPEIFKEFIEKKHGVLFEDIKENLEQGIKEGFYRENLNVDLIARLYVKKIEDIHDSEYWKCEDISFEMVFEVVFESHIRAISNIKGVEYFEKQKQTINFNI